MGVCGTPWEVVEVETVWEAVSWRIPADTPDPEEIRRACESGEAVCLESPDGVLILTITEDERSLESELFILLAIGYRPGAFKRREPDLDNIAADLGASVIIMCPRRRGWARLLGQNWVRQGDVFAREVDYGRQEGVGWSNAAAAGAS
jgi:hypothetical protein